MSVNSGDELVLRRPPMGFTAPVLKGEVQEKRDGQWTPVVVTEEKTGFTVRDRRKIR